MNTGRQSKYMSLAAELASEKLEDLSRWNPDDPQICVSAGSSVGSLTKDVLQTTTCPPPLSQCTQTTGRSATVNYYDDVYMATVNSTDCPNTTYGCFSETVSSPGSGATIYTTTHAPDGTINVLTAPTMPSPTFHRRWIIEADSPVAGVSALCLPGTRRVTVLVTLMDLSVQMYTKSTQPTVSFQMSMVRPGN
jgi:hypothetical protein